MAGAPTATGAIASAPAARGTATNGSLLQLRRLSARWTADATARPQGPQWAAQERLPPDVWKLLHHHPGEQYVGRWDLPRGHGRSDHRNRRGARSLTARPLLTKSRIFTGENSEQAFERGSGQIAHCGRSRGQTLTSALLSARVRHQRADVVGHNAGPSGKADQQAAWRGS